MVILMLLIGFILVVYALVSILKESEDFQNILKNEEENSELWKIELGRIRSEFATTLSEMQSEVLDLRDRIDELRESNIQLDSKRVRIEEAPVEKNIVEKSQSMKIGRNKVNRTKLKSINKKENIGEPIKEVEKSTISEEKKETKSILVEEVRALIKEGYSLDEISEKLNVGKGEVLLIRQLYIN